MMGGTEPVLDGSCFRVLAFDLGQGIALRFMTEFRDLLPARVDRIQRMVGIRDREAAMDAVLSLASSASMVGGLLVAQQCRAIGRAVKCCDYITAQHASLALEGQTQSLAMEITTMTEHLTAGSSVSTAAQEKQSTHDESGQGRVEQ